MATGGAVPIGRLAGEVGWSHKQLTAKFRQQIGLRPKTAARLVRDFRQFTGTTPTGFAARTLPAAP